MIAQNLQRLRQQILAAEQRAGRPPGAARLLAVSKSMPARAVAEAYGAGQRHFGENYLQEALAKQRELAAYAITWHFIGPIQSNKTRLLASHFNWVHSVDSLRIARRLHEQRPAHLPPLNVCVQVNISGEASKSGVELAGLAQLCQQLRALDRLSLRGVMAIPAPAPDADGQRETYGRLRQAAGQLALTPPLDTFSYGMSGDFAAAIMEGATWVRLGTAVFGERGAARPAGV